LFSHHFRRWNDQSKFKTTASLVCVTQALQDDVETLEPSMANIKCVVGALSGRVDDGLRAHLDRSAERLGATWSRVVGEAHQKNLRLKEALEVTRSLAHGAASLAPWIDELAADVASSDAIHSTAELSAALRKLNALKNRIDAKSVEYKSVVDAGAVLFLIDSSIQSE